MYAREINQYVYSTTARFSDTIVNLRSPGENIMFNVQNALEYDRNNSIIPYALPSPNPNPNPYPYPYPNLNPDANSTP